ncbi:MAG: hypothetical protein IKV97_05615 [Clostridia bacterium]|nr:hypothetical protein [Clostridia bacterium]
MNYRTKKGRELLCAKIEEYFEMCDEANLSSGGKYAAKPYTLSGLLYHLDMSEDELCILEHDRNLCRIIGCAKRRIEAYIEENALSGKLASTAAINSLKSRFGWSDKQQEENPLGFEILLDEEAARLGA